MLEIKTYGGDKIGGCVTEISSKTAKIIFDYGTNLDGTKQIEIEGLTKGESKVNAVFISHYHLDHIGEVSNILEEIPIYIEETTKKLYDIICDFSGKPRIEAKTFRFGQVIEGKEFGDVKITPYRVDHSAYNSTMFVITDGEETALYTGDFRDNGYTGGALIPTLKKIGKVDYLITEGTNIGSKSHILEKEESLVEEFANIAREYKQVFVLMSSSNIDRITTMLKACNQTKHILIQDIYMAHLTSFIQKEDKKNIPNPVTFDNVMVYKPRYMKRKKDEFRKQYLQSFQGKNKSSMLYKPFMMNIRTSMLEDLEMFEFKGDILTNACLVYSMWGGYKEKEEIQNFLKIVQELGITVIQKDIHTSGHASEELIDEVKKITSPKKVFTIHTKETEESV